MSNSLFTKIEDEVQNSLVTLKSEGVLIYPTDTIWGIGCDATSKDAVNKIYEIKKRHESKSLVILVSDWDMLNEYVPEISDAIRSFLNLTDRPTTVVYSNPKGLASNVVAVDNSVAIRIVDNKFCQSLLAEFGKPIVSTSANLSGTQSPACFDDIDKSLLKKADYVVNLSRNINQSSASQIVKLGADGQVEFIRK